MKEENLIFIASQPRSGSTFLQNVLSNNIQTNTVSEPWVMLALAPLLNKDLVVNATYDHNLAMDAFTDYTQKVNIRICKEFKNLALQMYSPLFEGHDFVIDKTPRYWEILDNLVEMFPDSKIVILKRNPLDVVRSMVQTWGIKTIEHLNYYRNDLLNAPLQMDAFIKRQEGNPNIISLQYTDMVNNKTGFFADLYQRLGITFSEDVLNTSGNKKYKGKYGDPYQNNKSKNKTDLSKLFKDFNEGYAKYLGKDYFLKNNYTIPSSDKSYSFSYFMSLGSFRKKSGLADLKREAKLYLKKQMVKHLI